MVGGASKINKIASIIICKCLNAGLLRTILSDKYSTIKRKDNSTISFRIDWL